MKAKPFHLYGQQEYGAGSMTPNMLGNKVHENIHSSYMYIYKGIGVVRSRKSLQYDFTIFSVYV